MLSQGLVEVAITQVILDTQPLKAVPRPVAPGTYRLHPIPTTRSLSVQISRTREPRACAAPEVGQGAVIAIRQKILDADVLLHRSPPV